MLDERVRKVMDPRKLLLAAPQLSVRDASRRMARRRTGAVLVVQRKALIGIFTERDALFRVVAKDRDPRATRLSEVMTPAPTTIAPDESFGYALLLMHEHGFRHLPVVVDGVPIGIVSARSALDPELEEFAAEATRRAHIRRKT